MSSTLRWLLGLEYGFWMFTQSLRLLPSPRSQGRSWDAEPDSHSLRLSLNTQRVVFASPRSNTLEAGCPVQVIAEGECPPHEGG